MKFRDIDFSQLDKEYKPHNLDTVEPFWKKYIKESERTNNEIER